MFLRFFLIVSSIKIILGFNASPSKIGHKESYRMLYNEPFWMQSQGFFSETKYALIVGIGDGDCMRENYKDCHCVGLDVNPKNFNKAKMKYPSDTFILGNIEESIFNPNSFDHIFLRIPVLHLKKKKETIMQLYRILKKKGKLCVIDYDETHPYRLELYNIPYAMRIKVEKDFNTDGILYLKDYFTLDNVIVENGFKKFTFSK